MGAMMTVVALVVIGFGLSGMLWGYAIGYVVTATIGLWILGFRPSLPERRHVLSLFDYAKFAWLGSMRSRTFDTVDIAVLGFFVAQGLIGIYAVAWSIGKFLDTFGSAVSSTLFPEMSKIAAENDAGAVAGLTEDAMAYAGLILIPGVIGAAVIGDRILLIYGDAFVAGTDVLVILVVSLLVYTYSKQLLNTLNAIDRPDLAFRANAVFIVSNVILNVILISVYGWVGAAVATALSAAIGLLVAVRYTHKLVPFALPLNEIASQWLAAGTMGLVVYAGRWIEETYQLLQYNFVTVLLLVTLGATTYFLTLLTISPHFRTTVERNLPFDLLLELPI
jgi:O-antigen/teichoic acid export membrane protein